MGARQHAARLPGRRRRGHVLQGPDAALADLPARGHADDVYESPDGSVHRNSGQRPILEFRRHRVRHLARGRVRDPPGIAVMAPGAVPSMLFTEAWAYEPDRGPDGRIAYDFGPPRVVATASIARASRSPTGQVGPPRSQPTIGCTIFVTTGRRGAEWSPDGSKIAYGSGGAVMVANADGSNPTLADRSARRPSWDRRTSLPPHPPWQSAGQLLVGCGSGIAGLGEAGAITRINSNGSGRTDFLALDVVALFAWHSIEPTLVSQTGHWLRFRRCRRLRPSRSQRSSSCVPTAATSGRSPTSGTSTANPIPRRGHRTDRSWRLASATTFPYVPQRDLRHRGRRDRPSAPDDTTRRSGRTSSQRGPLTALGSPCPDRGHMS